MTTPTTDTLTADIRQSIDQRETVTVLIDSETDVLDVLAAIYASPLCEDYDSTSITPTLTDVWGQTADGQEWRLHVMQAERTGAARYRP